MERHAALPLEEVNPEVSVRWFAPYGCVVERGAMCEVTVSGTLIGQFERDGRDRGERNVLLVTLARDRQIGLGRLAWAFGVSEEYLRLLRKKAAAGGLAAVLLRRSGGKERITARQRAGLRRSFAEGLRPAAAYREQPKKSRLSVATVQREYRRWREENGEQVATPPSRQEPESEPGTNQLGLFASHDAPVDHQRAAEESDSPIVPLAPAPVRAGQFVQHLGSWLMVALAHAQGLHDEAARHDRGSAATLRISLDAVIMALAIGERCVEGVRRLATPTAPLLLRAAHTPTASFVRRRLWKLGEDGGAALAAGMTTRYLELARQESGPAVFYVDNHLRPYTGKHVVRKGWRMQDRRVLPGTTDYYVHDEDGCPVFRLDVPSHDSLTQWMPQIAERLREGLGEEERILLGFDRAGAYAEQVAQLRDAGFELVTYERKPYPAIPASSFKPVKILNEEVGLHESRLRNLGAGRGRVRRIAILAADGRQVNVLAVSREPAERLVEILWQRWRQENAFKHGVERWGINQLDGRRLTTYPPGTIIPNPLRRRLDRALRIARVEEGMARRTLARVSEGPARERAERDLANALARQEELEPYRPLVPMRAPVEETELASTLVRHTGELKGVVDSIRIACANAEADLAALIAPSLNRPREAKKVIANLLSAPGDISVTRNAIRLRLSPAANRNESEALDRLLKEVSSWDLILPGDPQRRPLRLEPQPS